jgi:crotonobetainyl-CoA:carnitine CoA-transferase CaiB-like acyl-CoA transferase
MQSTQSLPLHGLKVLEFTHAVLGPTCGMLLADFGAEVIKIEPAPDGDPTRRLRGFGMGFAPYLFRNRKCVTIDLKSELGKEAVDRLLKSADILVENFGPGTIDRLGFGYDALAERYPRLIYCSLKGFLPGPYEKRIALDEIVQMMSGLAYMTGPPGQPLRAGASVIDMMTGVYGAVGILLALRDREQTGKGQLVRSALFETAASLMGQHMAYSAVSQTEVPPMPARISAWGIYHQFQVANGEIVFVGVTSDKQWARFCTVFGRDDLFQDQRLATNNGRVLEQSWLLPQLRMMFVTMEKAAVIALCEKAGLPFSPVARPEDLFDDPQLNLGNSLLKTLLPDGRETKLPRLPVRVGAHDFGMRSQVPPVGHDNQAVLGELGFTAQEIEQMTMSALNRPE